MVFIIGAVDSAATRSYTIDIVFRSRASDKLIATGSAELIEGNNHWDRYWGVCRGEGQNKLGKLLMRVREEVITDNKGQE